MRSTSWRWICPFLIVSSFIGYAGDCVHADEPASTYIGEPDDPRVREALARKLVWDFRDTPLSDIVNEISDALGIEVVLDEQALEDFGFDRDTPVTFRIQGVSTRSSLRLLLNELDLTYIPRDSTVLVTSPDEAEIRLITRIYPVGDIVSKIADTFIPPSSKHAARDEDFLVQTIESTIAPDTWTRVGGYAGIEVLFNSLIISQTRERHHQIEELLVAYRGMMKQEQAPGEAGLQPLMIGHDNHDHLRAALETRLTMIIRGEGLRDALSVLAEDCQVPIVVDTRALEDFGVDSDAPVNARFAELPLKSVLRRLLDPLELTYVLRDEVIRVTTSEGCEAQLRVGLYPVGRLVGDIDAQPEAAGYNRLIKVITATVAPDSWAAVGGRAGIGVLPPAPVLVISQTPDVHDQITKLLVNLAAAKARVPKTQEADTDAITLQVYHPITLGFPIAEAKEVVAIVTRDSDPGTWDGDGVFIQPLGQAIVVKHQADVHARVSKTLRQLGFGAGMGERGGGFDGPAGQPQRRPQFGGGGPFF